MEQWNKLTKEHIEKELDEAYKRSTAYKFELLQQATRQFWIAFMDSVLKCFKTNK